MSYRDLDDEPPEEPPADPTAQLASPAARAPDATPRRRPFGFAVLVGVLVTVIAALAVLRVVEASQPAPAAAPVDTSASTTAPGLSAATSTNTSPPTSGTGTPSSVHVDPAPTGDAPEPTSAADGGAAALSTAQRFIPAWTTPGTASARTAALSDVATPQLTAQLAPVDATRLPKVTGAPKLRQATPAVALVDVPTSAGTAALTVQPTAGGWRVTGVSLQAAPPTRPAGTA